MIPRKEMFALFELAETKIVRLTLDTEETAIKAAKRFADFRIHLPEGEQRDRFYRIKISRRKAIVTLQLHNDKIANAVTTTLRRENARNTQGSD